MKDKIRDAFGQVHADPARKARTKAYVLARMEDRRRPRLKAGGWMPRMAAAAACLLLMAAGGYWLYFVPTAQISIDINPSLELSVNRFDHVIGVEGWNEDGQALAESLDIRFENYADAVETILADQEIVALLADGGVMDITVVGPENAQCGRMLAALEDCTAGHQNARCHTAQPEELEAAHDLGLSCGKYRAYLEVQALDPDITPEEVGGMTMREIRDLVQALEKGTDPEDASSGAGQTQGGHHHGPHHGHE